MRGFYFLFVLLLFISNPIWGQEDSVLLDCWLISHCDTPEGNNLDSISSLVKIPVGLEDARGTVVIRARIDSLGKIVEYDIIKKYHPLFSEQVEKLIPYIRFELGECCLAYYQSVGFDRFWLTMPIRIRRREE